MFDSQSLRIAASLTLMVLGACGKRSDSNASGDVPDVAAASVSGGGSPDADMREIERYELGMPKIERWAAAAEALKKLERENPQAAQQEEDSSDTEPTMSSMQAAIERRPAERKAIQDAGLKVREYLLITMALTHVMAGHTLVQQGQNADSVARKYSILPANLRFAKEHQAELAKLRRLLQE